MISPLGRGHRGGALNISSGSALDGSWGRGGVGGRGCTEATLGPAAAVGGCAAAALGQTTAAAPGVEVSVGGVGLWHTCGRKE